ncbi:MAG: DUF1349 domain-containing protein [Chitinophagaceae bacterium]
MIRKIFVQAFGMLLILSAARAQQEARITGIPFPLYWDNQPKNHSVKGNTLTIDAGEKTDMFRDPNVTYNTDNAPKLLFKPDENFVLTAIVEHPFTNKWDGGAIVVKADSLHWIKFCFEKDYTGAKRMVSVVTKDVSDDCNSIAITSSKVHMKIAKAGNVFTLYASQDGKNWLLLRHLQFNMDAGFRVGFLAQSPTGASNRVVFSNITYEAKKIKDPYVGE